MADFDVFLSHNSKDKPVRQIAAKLRERGITPWLDEEVRGESVPAGRRRSQGKFPLDTPRRLRLRFRA